MSNNVDVLKEMLESSHGANTKEMHVCRVYAYIQMHITRLK